MIKFEHTEVVGWEAAIRGMRNPKNSWDKSDSYYKVEEEYPWDDTKFMMGNNDHNLAMMLRNAGTDHRKFMRMLTVYVDITAPLFWWKEFDTYKVGTVRDSCSTMHKIHVKEFVLADFSHEGISEVGGFAMYWMMHTLTVLNGLRDLFNATHEKKYWRALIEALPENFNMKATVEMNYEVIANAVKPGSRLHHKLDEWNVAHDGSFCQWALKLPYPELIFGQEYMDSVTEAETNGQSI